MIPTTTLKALAADRHQLAIRAVETQLAQFADQRTRTSRALGSGNCRAEDMAPMVAWLDTQEEQAKARLKRLEGLTGLVAEYCEAELAANAEEAEAEQSGEPKPGFTDMLKRGAKAFQKPPGANGDPAGVRA